MPRSFAEIFADWETGRTSASGNHSGKSSGKSSSKKSTSKKNESVEMNQPKVNPMELGLRRYGIVDKDKEALERAEEPRKQSMGKRKIQNSKRRMKSTCTD